MLKLHNTLTRQVEPFTPANPQTVGMYVCGITPYDWAHIGHARVYVVFDVLFRLLRHLYGEDAVTYVRNFTDIDDKIIARAAENGEEPTALAQRFITAFHEDMDALGCLRPTSEPRVSDAHVLQGIAQHVDALVEKGFAYETPSGDVMFESATFPTFGQLAGRKLDEQKAGARVAVDDEKRAPEDFVLWKANEKSATKMAQAFSPAALGARHFSAEGRPGWHIECSVMSKQTLGAHFDLHGGGEDLKFPHHCCEIAQSEALTGAPMARHWVHNAFITVNGTKMSKSLGNFVTIRDALETYSPQAIRLWLLQTPYRNPVDYSEGALLLADQNLYVREYHVFNDDIEEDLSIVNEFIDIISDDLDTAKAVSYIISKRNKLKEAISKELKVVSHDTTLSRESIREYQKSAASLFKCWSILGIKVPRMTFDEFLELEKKFEEYMKSEEVTELLQARSQARTAKNWAESDRLRDELKARGIVVEDHKDGTTTWRRA